MNKFPGSFIYILTGRTTRQNLLKNYVGKTKDLVRRTLEHQKEKKSFGGKVRSETIKIVYFEQFEKDLLNPYNLTFREKQFKDLFNKQVIFKEERKW